ncbi:hypothetical protein, partial [Mammaliicoccus sciuri]|uniref:hypothetical protein n=1 Tax=Mammaliicoccus sciuri TaxID=1296 RepID=UPI001301A09C
NIEALKERTISILLLLLHPKWIEFLNDLEVDKVINLSNIEALKERTISILLLLLHPKWIEFLNDLEVDKV